MANNKKEYTIKFNGIEKTINDVGKLDKETKKLEGTVEDLRLDQAFKVNVQGVAIQFENISQAISELDDIAQGAAGKMQMLKQAGKENTEEYQKLAAQFQEVVTQAAELERARKYSDELKDSLSSTTRGLDLAVGAFQSVGAAMEVASGVAGLFGESEEEIQKAMNRTVQIMGVLNGVQELYNQTVKKGTLLQMANAKVNKLVASIMPAMSAGIKGATVATKAFGFALKAAGIGLITTAIALLIEYWDDLKQAVVSVFPALGKAREFFSKTKAVLAGVGNAIIQWIINPFKTAAAVISKLFSGDFSGAMEEAKKGLKAQFDVAGNYQKGYTAVQKNEEEKRRKQAAEAASKELDYQIKMLEAKKGSDAKYTEEARKLYEEYFNNLLSMYDKDSDEYKQAVIDKENYDREFKENTEKKQKEALEKAKKAAEDHARKLKEVNKQIAENELAAMKDGFEKKRLELERQKLEEIKIATERGVKVKEAIKSIELKYNKLEIDLIKEHSDAMKNAYATAEDTIVQKKKGIFSANIQIANDFLRKAYADTVSIIQNAFKNIKQTSKKFKTASISDILAKEAKKINETVRLFAEPQGTKLSDIAETYTVLFDRIQDVTTNFEEDFSKTIKDIYSNDIFNDEEMQKEAENYRTLIDFAAESVNKLKGQIASLSEEEKTVYSASYAILSNILQAETHQRQENLEANKKWYDEKTKMLYDNLMSELITEQEYDKLSEEAEIAYQANMVTINGEYYAKINEEIQKSLQERNQITIAYNDYLVDSYNTAFEKILADQDKFANSRDFDLGSGELNFIADFSQSIISANKFKDKYKEISDDIAKQKKDLQDKFDKGIIDKETFDQTSGQLNNLQKNIDFTLKNSEKSVGEWARDVGDLVNAGFQMVMQTFTMFGDMQYQNTMKRIEEQKEALDKENEQLQESLDEQTEIYERHNEQIQTLEDELANSRGSRRQFLLDQIGAEMSKREEAWSQQKAIERQQAMNEKKKAALEEQAKAAEKKRNKQQKKAQIAQATMSTALAVTNALALHPFWLGLAMASLAGVMGAAQIAIIAKTKFADGGLLQGNSHANGGIPVGNTGIEVEGNEYVINKHSTQANLPVIEMINSKKRKLNINDFVEFYNGKSVNNSVNSVNKFENGGILPSIDFNPKQVAQQVQTDNRPIYVSVQEIERVGTHLRNVRAVAGLD